MADLVRWDPFREIASLREDFNRAFAPWWRTPTEREWATGTWAPPVDIYETKDDVIVTTEVPGLKEDEVDLSVRKNILTITGTMKEEPDLEGRTYHYRERRWGTFQRSFTLPVEVNAEAARASFRNGILEVRLPKAEEAKPKSIKIDVH
ncbi:MAG: Hsp20/alpha crystallin family protein [Firmicutes bacterium]|nr:Hsp20/alpha crystallin family protein [Bacillota bacterium]MCL5040706.1 Hsp20/alpha crystallin family protein [Bacillota bacterium]